MTIRETARKIVNSCVVEVRYGDDEPHLLGSLEQLTSKIEAALRAEHEKGYEQGANELIEGMQSEYLRGQREARERAAKIADEWWANKSAMGSPEGEAFNVASIEIAAAIREDAE